MLIISSPVIALPLWVSKCPRRVARVGAAGNRADQASLSMSESGGCRFREPSHCNVIDELSIPETNAVAKAPYAGSSPPENVDLARLRCLALREECLCLLQLASCAVAFLGK